MRKTIFDDVFRTICQKMPVLLIALVNEVFGTDYPDSAEIQQFRNEHLEKFGKIITDALIQIENTLYHIECQSSEDDLMVIRMFQYDFAIAIEKSIAEGSLYRVKFPQSCVIYIRGNKKHDLQMEVEMPDSTVFQYRTKSVNVQDYSKDEIFRKKLLMFLPYYILRYEKSMPTARKEDKEKLEALLADYEDICSRLEKTLNEMEQSDLYTDLIELIKEISNHVIKSHKTKERMGNIMGGKLLELRSERDRRLGKEEEKRNNLLIYFTMIQEGRYTYEELAEKLKYNSVDDFKKDLRKCGCNVDE